MTEKVSSKSQRLIHITWCTRDHSLLVILFMMGIKKVHIFIWKCISLLEIMVDKLVIYMILRRGGFKLFINSVYLYIKFRDRASHSQSDLGSDGIEKKTLCCEFQCFTPVKFVEWTSTQRKYILSIKNSRLMCACC